MRLCAWNSLSGIYCMRGQVIHFKCRKPIFLRATFLMDFWKVGEESRSFFDVVELWWGDGAGDWEPDESRCWRKTHLSVYDYCGQPWFLWLCLYIYIFRRGHITLSIKWKNWVSIAERRGDGCSILLRVCDPLAAHIHPCKTINLRIQNEFLRMKCNRKGIHVFVEIMPNQYLLSIDLTELRVWRKCMNMK